MNVDANNVERRFMTFLRALGERDWNTVQDCFAPRIRVDFESLYGLPPSTNSPTTLTESWRALVEPLDTFYNELGEAHSYVDGAEVFVAIVTTVVMSFAEHQFAAHGVYESLWQQEDDGNWKMSSIRLNTQRVEGEPNILARASEERSELLENAEVELETLRSRAGVERPLRFYRPARTPHRAPCVVVIGASDPLRSCTGARYARQLAARGLPAFSFDVQTTNPHVRGNFHVESFADVRHALQHCTHRLATDPDLGCERITVIGLGFGAAFAIDYATDDPRVTQLILLAPWWYEKHELDALYERARYHHLEEMNPQEASDAAAARSRGALVEWRAFKALRKAAEIDQPTLIISSRDATAPAAAEKLYNTLQSYRGLEWVPGAQHHFVSAPETMDRVLARVIEELDIA